MYPTDNESEKRETTEGTILSNKETIRTLGKKENYKYLGKPSNKQRSKKKLKIKLRRTR